MTNLYENMAKHPDIKPTMDLLELVEPCDEFSRALILLRDCFSPNTTLRMLSRRALREVCSGRVRLLHNYQTVVSENAKALGYDTRSFEEAWNWLPKSTRERLQSSYAEQVKILMGR